VGATSLTLWGEVEASGIWPRSSTVGGGQSSPELNQGGIAFRHNTHVMPVGKPSVCGLSATGFPQEIRSLKMGDGRWGCGDQPSLPSFAQLRRTGRSYGRQGRLKAKVRVKSFTSRGGETSNIQHRMKMEAGSRNQGQRLPPSPWLWWTGKAKNVRGCGRGEVNCRRLRDWAEAAQRFLP
jgi:hypothetical protein